MKKLIFVSAVVIAFLCPAYVQATIVYEVIDLGTLGGDLSIAYSINDVGQIVPTPSTTPARSWERQIDVPLYLTRRGRVTTST
jgi:hypothetical protein